MNKRRKTKEKAKKNIIQKLITFFTTLIVIGIIIYTVLTLFNISIVDEIDNMISTVTSQPKKKTVINALVCGLNENMTDTIIYVRYEPKTGKIGMMSIPRDTSIAGSKPTANASNKLNSVYRGTHTEEFVSQVEKLLDVNIDYYLFFDSEMLISMVDEIGGVEVEVPIRMKYDDPTQDLHIDLQPGKQVLNGKQAEQFVRFRKNNDGSGYARGDVDRVEAQQEFIKSFISTVLKPKNILKIKSLIEIALNQTDTNVTLREALRYSTDITKIDMDNIVSCTAPGDFYDAKNPYWVSFWILNQKEAHRIITEEFSSGE